MIEIAIAPIVILLFYMYVRDVYEKEPIKLLITGIIIGAIISPVIIFLEEMLSNVSIIGEMEIIFYISFIVAALVEEGVKFFFIYMLIYKNKEFNEPFDGIVYCTFVSLGFAMVENILYSINFPYQGIILARAITSVPMHAMYGIVMGYYFGKSKFSRNKKEKSKYLRIGLLSTIFYHGIYDFTLVAPNISDTITFMIIVVLLGYLCTKMVNISLFNSPFKSRYYSNKYKRLSKELEEIEIVEKIDEMEIDGYEKRR